MVWGGGGGGAGGGEAGGGEGGEGVGTRFLIRKSCLKVLVSRKLWGSSEGQEGGELGGLGNKCDQMCVVLGLRIFCFPGHNFLFVLVWQNLKIYRVVRNGSGNDREFDIILVKNLF